MQHSSRSPVSVPVSTDPPLPASAHAAGDLRDVLYRVLDPGVNLGLWQRPAEPTIAQELSPLLASDLPDVRCGTSPASFGDDLSGLLEQQGLEPASFEEHLGEPRQVDVPVLE